MTPTRVLALTAEQAVTLLTEPELFGERFGLAVAEGAVVFPEALEPIVEALEAGTDPTWFAHLIVDPEAAEVVGIGGFTGPPVDGVIEIGYGVAPGRRGRGHAVAAVREWSVRAERAGLRVVARTAPVSSASTTVLARCGFRTVGVDGDAGERSLWVWSRTPDTRVPPSTAVDGGTGGRAATARRSVAPGLSDQPDRPDQT